MQVKLGSEIMLEKIGLAKHRLFFIMVAIFLVKFFVVRYFLFEQVNIIETILAEIFYLFFIFGLIEIIHNERVKRITYITVNAIMSILLIGLILYHNYSGQVVSILMLSQINQVGTVKASVMKLLNPIYAILLLDLIILAIWRWRKKTLWREEFKPRKPLFLGVTLFLSFSMITFTIFTTKDELITNAAYFANTEGIFTYEAVTVIQKFTEPPKLTKKPAEIQKQIVRLKNVRTPFTTDYTGELQGKNVIFIQLEAFQDFLIHLQVKNQEITPFLNELSKNSLYFPNIYQQIAAGSTSDAEFISNTSLYPNYTEPTTKEFGNRNIPSLPKLLQEQGYHTFTMHANEVSFWNRENLYPALGFNEWYDSTYFFGENKEEEIVGIGLSDREFFEKSYDVLKDKHASGKPFYAQLITLTSHHPFVMPDEYKVLDLPEEYNGTLVGDYLQVAHYVDAQLRMFFKLLDQDGLLDDSIVVLYGDHQALQVNTLKIEEKELLDAMLGHEYSFIDQYNIPLFIHAPKPADSGDTEVLTEVVEQVGGQIDILPTVANLLGLNLDEFVHFGQDLLNTEETLFGMRYYMPYGSFFTNNVVYMTQSSYEDGAAYDLKTHEQLPSVNLFKQYERIMALLELNDQYLNSLPLREETE